MSLPSTINLMLPCFDDARMPVASCVEAFEDSDHGHSCDRDVLAATLQGA
jgi:hypothetical protein